MRGSATAKAGVKEWIAIRAVVKNILAAIAWIKRRIRRKARTTETTTRSSRSTTKGEL
jgi:hypothetical protein